MVNKLDYIEIEYNWKEENNLIRNLKQQSYDNN